MVCTLFQILGEARALHGSPAVFPQLQNQRFQVKHPGKLRPYDSAIPIRARWQRWVMVGLLSASIAGCADPPIDPLAPSGMCAVASTAKAPFPTEFRFRNTGTAPLFVSIGCLGVEYGLSSCASGFRDQLAPGFACGGCPCGDTGCKAPDVQCGPCMGPAAQLVAPGESAAVPWIGVSSRTENLAGRTCVRTRTAPAGRYRVAIRIYATADAAARSAGGQIVTGDFQLPADQGVVDVPLVADQSCDATPDGDAPTCTGAQAHDMACALPQPFDFANEGGLAQAHDSASVAPPAVYTRTRTFVDPAMPARTCAAPIPRCSRDARVVTTGDLTAALNAPGVQASFTKELSVFGYDSRNNDGGILILRRPDGTVLGIGEDCSLTVTGCNKPIPLPLAQLSSTIGQFDQQMRLTPECAGLAD
jgi:hypothetical protein